MIKYLKKISIPFAAAILNFLFLKSQLKRLHAGRRIIVLNFHNPSIYFFQRHIDFLRKNNFDFVSLSQMEALSEGKFQNERASVFLSFDDGWRGNMNIMPLVMKYKLPVCFFLNTKPIIDSGYFHLPQPNQKKEREALTKEEVISLSKNSLVSFGAHTHSHKPTTSCSDKELNEEIRMNKDLLEQWTERKITAFAYPNGKYNGNETGILKENGIYLAFTLGNKFADTFTDKYYIPRFGSVERAFSESICKITGLWSRFF